MVQLETLEVMAFIQDTNRCPIMVINGNKVLSLENAIKDELGQHLNIVSEHYGRRYGPGFGWHNKPLPPNVRLVDSQTKVAEVRPHAKKLRITIEVEE